MARTLLPLTLAASFAALLAPGCSSTTEDDQEAACRTYVEAMVNLTSRCDAPAPDDVRGHLLERGILACKVAFQETGSGVTSVTVKECADALPKIACGDPSPAACQDIRGSLGDGAACRSSYQCAGGLCAFAPSVSSALPTCGTCAARLAVGATCEGQSNRCVYGSQCVNARCIAYSNADVGAPCVKEEAHGCKTGLYCDTAGDTTSSSGTCKAMPGEGAACGNGFTCEEGLTCSRGSCVKPGVEGGACGTGLPACGDGLACNPLEEKCIKVAYGKAGARCGLATRCAVGRCSGDDTDSGEGVCPAILGDGQACDAKDTSKTCDEFAECLNGTCQIPDGAKLCAK